MTLTSKRTLLFSILICIVAIFVINAALPLHTFEAGNPFPSSPQMIQSRAAASGNEAPPTNTLILKGSLSIFFFIIAGYLLLLVFRKTTWKQVGRAALFLLAVLLFIFVLSLINPQQVEITPAAQESSIEAAPPFTYRTEPIQSPPIAWQWIAAATMFIFIAGGTAYFIFREPVQEKLENQIAREARSAMQALQAGDDFRTVILYCYQEMSRVIQEAESINREEAMTVREFESSLNKTSLPMSAIQQLSRLFENARYSNTEPSAEEQQLCLNSLQTIIDHCKAEGMAQ
jgi:hypothetical protein